LSEKFL